MVIAIWGRDGIGKSTLADALGVMFSKKKVVVVIDTDLTQPTLPSRIKGIVFDGKTSLGKAVSGVSAGDATPFLHQHPKHKNLFYAGLTDRDEYMSHEIGLEGDKSAQDFIRQCAELADTVILDLSGQRYDPFLFGALINAHKVVVPFTPDVQGVCWYNAVKPLFEGLKAQDRVLPVAAMEDKHHDLPSIEKAAGIHFAVALPFVKEFRYMRDTGVSPLDGATSAAFRYMCQINKICVLLRGSETV